MPQEKMLSAKQVLTSLGSFLLSSWSCYLFCPPIRGEDKYSDVTFRSHHHGLVDAHSTFPSHCASIGGGPRKLQLHLRDPNPMPLAKEPFRGCCRFRPYAHPGLLGTRLERTRAPHQPR